MAKKMGLINRFIIGSEKSEGYARASLPSNRWELFWDVFKGRFGKLVLINLLVLLFCLPAVAVMVLRVLAISGYGSISPFTQPFGAGYQGAVSFSGYAESIVFNANAQIYLYLPVAMIFAAIGISGGAYVIRNMIWTEGIFVANDFWRGVKQNFFSVTFILFGFSVVFYLAELGVAYDNLEIVRGSNIPALLYISKYLLIIVAVFAFIMTMHMISLTVTYKLTVRQLIKDAFLLTMGLLPHSVFFAAIAVLPYVFFLINSSFTIMIGAVIMLFISFSFSMMVWTDFSQWAYDMFINDKVPGAQKNRGIYEKVKDGDSAALRKYKEQMELASRSSLSSRPIKPITDEEITLAELPQSFSRGDIQKLNDSRREMYEDNERYIKEHENDSQFVEIKEEKEKKEKEDELKIAKAKKELEKRKGKNKKSR